MSTEPLSPFADEPQAVTPMPIARAPTAANPTRATVFGPPCLPSARPLRRLTGFEKRLPIKSVSAFPDWFSVQAGGRLADLFGRETVEGGTGPSNPRGSAAQRRRARPTRSRRPARPWHRAPWSSRSRRGGAARNAGPRGDAAGPRARARRRRVLPLQSSQRRALERVP